MTSSLIGRELADQLLRERHNVTLKQWLHRTRGMSDRQRETTFLEDTGVHVGRSTLIRWMEQHNTVRL